MCPARLTLWVLSVCHLIGSIQCNHLWTVALFQQNVSCFWSGCYAKEKNSCSCQESNLFHSAYTRFTGRWLIVNTIHYWLNFHVILIKICLLHVRYVVNHSWNSVLVFNTWHECKYDVWVQHPAALSLTGGDCMIRWFTVSAWLVVCLNNQF